MSADITWHTSVDTQLTIAYAGSTVVLGFKQSDGLLIVHMSSPEAIHLMMELREALKDLHTEGE